MREIVLDTETTGLDPASGHRIVEIACVELFNRFPTGQSFHRHINPQRDMPAEAFAVHGLSAEFLREKPTFADIADQLIAFIGDDAALVIHNAEFDLAFINAELARLERALIARERLVDTLLLARRRHPNGPNSLDHLCVRYGIDNTRRTKHSALLDAELLAQVYIELIGGRQAQLGLVEVEDIAVIEFAHPAARPRPQPLPTRVTESDLAAHAAFIATLGANAIWNEYARA
jgi:DNA polymerase-3 subunit epsilon